MELAITDIIRGCVSSIMNAILLFLMAQPRYSKKVTGILVFVVFSIDIITSILFYKIGQLTALAQFDIILFLALGIILKPFVKDSIAKWFFHFLTAINIYFIIAYLSYFLADLFPHPFYANSFVRLALYLGLMLLYCKKLRPLYLIISDSWKAYFILVFAITVNFTYYIFDSEDIEVTFSNSIHLFLLIILAMLVYITIFYLLKKDLAQQQIKQEKLHFRQMAFRDTLTGVGNRNGYEELMNEVETNLDNRIICVGAFDINDLKLVNDTHGHDVGDQYIRDCCQIICKAHQTSAVFRMGGDEFIIVCENAPHKFIQESKNNMDELIRLYNSESSHYKVSIAYGYEIFNNRKHKFLNDVKDDADRLMYENKRRIKESRVSKNCNE